LDVRLAHLRELVRADEAHSSALAELDELARRTAALRDRAEELSQLLAAAPAERERLVAEVEEGEREVRRQAAVLAEAERELAAAEAGRDRERLAAARRFVVRAKDALAMAEKRLAGSRAEREALEARIEAAEREVPVVEADAVGLAGSFAERPRFSGRAPEPELAGVCAWASEARAALLVARGGVAAEREAVIRQANELASAILGEPLVATSAAVIARRVEQALRGRSPP
jgi:hypothetical protein